MASYSFFSEAVRGEDTHDSDIVKELEDVMDGMKGEKCGDVDGKIECT